MLLSKKLYNGIYRYISGISGQIGQIGQGFRASPGSSSLLSDPKSRNLNSAD